MKFNRLQEMESYIRKNHSVTNEELVEHFNISLQTLRRDLKELEKRNVITKVYGGVVACQQKISPALLPMLSQRMTTNILEKNQIGQSASKLIQDGDVIFVDSGSTAYTIIPYIQQAKVTVISHSIDVMNAIQQSETVTGICLGGKLNKQTQSFYSDVSLNSYYYNKAFIATVGLSLSKGLTNMDINEGIIKQSVIQNSEEVWIMADHTKFGNVTFNKFSDLNGITGIITDKKPDPCFLQFFKNQKVKVIY